MISCKKKKKKKVGLNLIFPSFYTSGSGSTDQNEWGSDRIHINVCKYHVSGPLGQQQPHQGSNRDRGTDDPYTMNETADTDTAAAGLEYPTPMDLGSNMPATTAAEQGRPKAGLRIRLCPRRPGSGCHYLHLNSCFYNSLQAFRRSETGIAVFTAFFY